MMISEKRKTKNINLLRLTTNKITTITNVHYRKPYHRTVTWGFTSQWKMSVFVIGTIRRIPSRRTKTLSYNLFFHFAMMYRACYNFTFCVIFNYTGAANHSQQVNQKGMF